MQKFIFYSILFILVSSFAGFESTAVEYKRTIDFSGFYWKVKSSQEAVGPGPNYFSDSEYGVKIDENGFLNMSVWNSEKKITQCTEVVSDTFFGYGKFIFEIEGDMNLLARSSVFGLFLWDTKNNKWHTREVDIEFSKWGIDQNMNAQFVVQPDSKKGHKFRFVSQHAETRLIQTVVIDWSEKKIIFSAYVGKITDFKKEKPYSAFEYTKKIPKPGAMQVRMNLWRFKGKQMDKQQESVSIRKFQYIKQ